MIFIDDTCNKTSNLNCITKIINRVKDDDQINSSFQFCKIRKADLHYTLYIKNLLENLLIHNLYLIMAFLVLFKI